MHGLSKKSLFKKFIATVYTFGTPKSCRLKAVGAWVHLLLFPTGCCATLPKYEASVFRKQWMQTWTRELGALLTTMLRSYNLAGEAIKRSKKQCSTCRSKILFLCYRAYHYFIKLQHFVGLPIQVLGFFNSIKEVNSRTLNPFVVVPLVEDLSAEEASWCPFS